VSSGRLQVEWFFDDFQEITRVRGVIHVIIAGTLGLAWFALTIAFTSLFLTRVRGYGLDEAGNMLAIATSVGFLGSVLLPALSDSLGRKPVGIAGAIGAGLIYIVFPLVPMPTLALVALLTFGGMCAGGLVSLTVATLLSELVPGRRGAAIGIANFLSATLGSLLSPIYGGVLADHFGLALPLVLAGVFQLLTAPVLFGVPETAPRVLARRGTAAKAAKPTSQ
jgi:ACS family hexuronate transporter-like MFS transporter